MFSKDLEAIDQLRSAAVQAVDPHFSGIKKLQAYAAQLVWLGGKFPIDVCRVVFRAWDEYDLTDTADWGGVSVVPSFGIQYSAA